ncbi:YwhD family protein [Salirhabdus salicampi]|uniref:YwhD family protein n=1 Tax=Salirhabdus salicampi TaxID=476102 RepID=UPI0020C25FAA|nr:YwhD family protein [Salirhabdus salicampi]MCP8617394.1 YwhD family protein [Salirhabdus salicampi]
MKEVISLNSFFNSDNNNEKKSKQFTIMKDDSTDGHGGYGVGSVSLENVSPVIVDPNEHEAYVDMGAMHARSAVEKRIKFLTDKSEVPNGKLYWIAWVTVERSENGAHYYGVTASEMLVDKEIRRGYKLLPEHVNHLDKSLKGRFIVEHMDATSKKILKEYLQTFNEEYWNNSSEELKKALA